VVRCQSTRCVVAISGCTCSSCSSTNVRQPRIFFSQVSCVYGTLYPTEKKLLKGQLMMSDLLVIACPMWNFGIPSSLKAWIDYVVRAGKTFNYAGAGVEGLAKGKKAILVLASGGVFSEGPWKSWDYVEPYLRQILGFIGIEDVQTVRAEGMNIPPLAIHAVPNGEKAVEALVI
jgi:FMN-dependent NADH-azoreductase